MNSQFGQFDINDRRQQKQASREADERRMYSGQASSIEIRQQNGFFSSLDHTKARIVKRRVRVAAAA